MAQLNDLLVTGSSRFLNDINANEVKTNILQGTIYGTGTAAQDKGSGVSPRYFPAKWTFNTGHTPTDGDIVTITIPVAGHSYGVFVSIDNGTSYHPVNVSGTARLTTHYGVGVTIQLVFDADGTTSDMYALNGADARAAVTGGCWRVINFYDSNSNTIPSAYCETAAGTAAKAASCSAYALLDKSYIHVLIRYANTSASAITLNINSTGAKAIYINGAASSSSNYTLPAGTYLVYYASNIFYFRTDGKLTADITGNAATVNGLTVQTAVPANAVFTDTNTKVTQTNSTANGDYRLLLSANANDTTETNTSIKSTNFKANPSTGLLTVKQSKSTVDKSMLTGTGTAAQDKGSGVSPRYFPAKWTFNTGITVADGDMFTIKIPVAGSGYGEFISVNNGTNYYPVGYNTNTLLTTHFPVGSIITVVFKSDGVINSIYPVAGGDAKVNVSGGAFYVLDLYDSGNSNTYDRNRYQGAIKVWGTALVAGNVIVAGTGTNAGLYMHLKQNAAFDITYPILYLNEAVAASGTTTNTYDILNIATATTQTGTWTAYKPVFIKGQLSGTIFTPISATPLTQTIPTTADGYEYILLGIATATTTVYLQERHPVYAYRNGKFGEIVPASDYADDAGTVNGLTVQTAVPASAVFTDTKVTQTATTTDATYEVLFSATADNTTRTEGARKTSTLRFNPSKGALMEGSGTTASGMYAHAEGNKTAASSNTAHAEGYQTTASGLYSHAEGQSTAASGNSSHAEGYDTNAYGVYAHVEGYKTRASDYAHAEGCYTYAFNGQSGSSYLVPAHAEGSETSAIGGYTHAEGRYSLSSGNNSHAEGYQTTASGTSSHTEGSTTYAGDSCSHAEGYYTKASDKYSHAEGYITAATSTAAHAEGYQTAASSTASHAEGNQTTASGGYSHAEGSSTSASNVSSHAEGYSTIASGSGSHTEGNTTRASGDYSHAEGNNTTASNNYSHAEGTSTSTSGIAAHAEGNNTKASGMYSHAEGKSTAASSNSAHAEGISTTSSGNNASHAEGDSTSASGNGSHAEGYKTIASGNGSHAEGNTTRASGGYSHAEGQATSASSGYSHAEGQATSTSGSYSHAGGAYTTASNFASRSFGHYNAAMTTGGSASNTTGTVLAIGNGTAANALKNAFSVQYNGVVKAASTITASTTADYAEYFEWADENPNVEDRVGYFVTFDNGDKIRFATSEDDYILGVTSGEPFVLGNGDCDVWNGMVLRDEFRRVIYEPAPAMEDVEGGGRIPKLDKNGNQVYNGTRPKINPNYDPNQPYVNRADRPEWCPVGMLGVLAVRDDGTCEVNGYATVRDDATATKYTEQSQNKYRVIRRNTQNVVEIVFR